MKPKRVYINENKLSLLGEDVYTKALDNQNKKALLTYKRGLDAKRYSQRQGESLKTDKMDNLNSDTYIIPLKNGINSYNITSIEGMEVMHYFKRYFSKQKTELGVKLNGKTETYELDMQNNEINQFLTQFVEKVNFVISDYISKHKELTDRKIYKLSQVCIYPVKSSSNFNSKIVNLLVKFKQKIFGLPVLKLNENLLKKDITNVQKDEDFLQKNADYYQNYRDLHYGIKTTDRWNKEIQDRNDAINKWNQEVEMGLHKNRKHGIESPLTYHETHMNALNTDINMLNARKLVNKEVENLNTIVKSMLTNLYQYRYFFNQGDVKNAEKKALNIASLFPDYCKRSSKDRVIMQYSKYINDYTREEQHKNNFKSGEYKYFRPKKSTKMPSVDQNTEEIIQITQQYNPTQFNTLKPEELRSVKVMYREPIDFQIKKIFNDSRMGLKNLFAFNMKELQKAKKEIDGNILVIFDDNVSGGATLSDICAQFMNMGVKHIIPITFGKMFQQWGNATTTVYAPKNGFVFGDNKTFVFNGKTFNTDEITNPMDAANQYTEKFGTYNKQGASELWKLWKNVKNNKNTELAN